MLKLAQGSAHRLGSIANVLLESVVELMPKCTSILLSSLVKSICLQDDTSRFQQHIQQKSLQVLRYLVKTKPMERKPLQLHAFNGNSLDKEIVRIETIEYNWDVIRRQRLQHFISQLSHSNLIDAGAYDDLIVSDLKCAMDLVLQDTWKCCELEVPSTAQEIIQNEEYRNACQIENHLFWLQIEVI